MIREQILAQVTTLLASGATDEGILAQVVELLHREFPHWHWVGIYLLVGEILHLGPFVGKATEHTRIPVGVGVCGTAVANDIDITIDDVRERDNYLACSLETRSELVVLIRDDAGIVAQFDVDSDRIAAFTPDDEAFLRSLAPIVARACRRTVGRLQSPREPPSHRADPTPW
jgi:L-methionine (R)-S-oxide reductase